MSARLRVALLACLLFPAASGAFLVSNSAVSGRFVFESVPRDRRPIDVLVDTEAVPGVADPRAVTQELMGQWNIVDGAESIFGTASAGGPFNGSTVGQTFGVFTNREFEVAFDDTGEIMAFFGIGPGVLGITLKSVDTDSGTLLDFLVVVNTQPGALSAPGTGASAEDLFRGTLLHELGHATGLGHTPVGMVNLTTFGFAPARPQRMPTMYAFRLPQRPQEGRTLEADDIAALARSYPDGSTGTGSISGRVRTASGAPVDEIAVRAVGGIGATDQHYGILSNADGKDQGNFTIPGLPPGGYRVIVEAVNGRGGVNEQVLAGGSDALGGHPFLYAADEQWQPGDTYDPAVDDPGDFALVQVRAGRDTGSIDFVLDASPLLEGQTADGRLESGDGQLPDAVGAFHFADYHVFRGDAGQTIDLRATAIGGGFTPQLRLLSPGRRDVADEDAPFFGSTAALATTLGASGLYTVVVSARASTGNPGGSGAYTLALNGAGGSLPPPPVPVAAQASRGPADPGPRQFSSPLCEVDLLQLHVDAPSHEELWIDRLRVRASGSGDDGRDVTAVSLVLDRDGDGSGRGDPVLATTGFAGDDDVAVFDDLGIELAPGTSLDLLVRYDVTVVSVGPTQSGFGGWWMLPVAGLMLLLGGRARRGRAAALAVALLAIGLTSCGGGGGGCNGTFDPAAAIVTFQAGLQPGDLVAFTPTTDPGTPLALPAAPVVSGTLTVSN